MHQRDLILDEIQKLFKILARIMGLKAEGKIEELNVLAENTIKEELDLQDDAYIADFPKDYESQLISKNYSADKLDLLAKILLETADSTEDNSNRTYKYRQVLVIYDILEKVYHIQSLQNLNTRSEIEKLLTTKYHG